MSNMIHLTNWVINGLPERFPKLKVDLDRERARVGAVPDAAARPRVPDAHVRGAAAEAAAERLHARDVLHHAADGERPTSSCSKATFEAINAETQLLYASDWPHWDFDVPGRLFDLPFLDDQAKRNILGYNAARVFNLEIPAKYRQPHNVAAE